MEEKQVPLVNNPIQEESELESTLSGQSSASIQENMMFNVNDVSDILTKSLELKWAQERKESAHEYIESTLLSSPIKRDQVSLATLREMARAQGLESHLETVLSREYISPENQFQDIRKYGAKISFHDHNRFFILAYQKIIDNIIDLYRDNLKPILDQATGKDVIVEEYQPNYLSKNILKFHLPEIAPNKKPKKLSWFKKSHKLKIKVGEKLIRVIVSYTNGIASNPRFKLDITIYDPTTLKVTGDTLKNLRYQAENKLDFFRDYVIRNGLFGRDSKEYRPQLADEIFVEYHPLLEKR